MVNVDIPQKDARTQQDLRYRSSAVLGPDTLNVTVPSYNTSLDSQRYVFEVMFVDQLAANPISEKILTVDLPAPVGNIVI